MPLSDRWRRRRASLGPQGSTAWAPGPRPRGRRWYGLMSGLLVAATALGGGGLQYLPRSFWAGRVAVVPSPNSYRYELVGNPGDVAPRTEPGMVLCGGGPTSTRPSAG